MDQITKKYIESGGGICPICGSDSVTFDIPGDGLEYTGEVLEVRDKYHCGDCEAKWTVFFEAHLVELSEMRSIWD